MSTEISSPGEISVPRVVVMQPKLASLWLRNAEFDTTLIGGCALWALACGALVVGDPRLFLPILALDIWLLGYQHVIATFVRLAVDRGPLTSGRFVLGALPVVVLAGTAGLVVAGATSIIATVYLYWQWFHYVRQSYGVSRLYLRKSLSAAAPAGGHPSWMDEAITLGVIYVLPLWGILHRSAQRPETFLNVHPIYVPVPEALLSVVAWLAVASVVAWLAQQVVQNLNGIASGPYEFYVASHIALFTTGYLIIQDINTGWLVLNVWHNAQYLLIVWLHNNKRFSRGVEPEHPFISALCQRDHAVSYVLVCLGVATTVYLVVQGGLSLVALPWIDASLVAYMAINFHHYIVDAIIWRRRRAQQPVTLRSTPALA